MEAKGRRKGRLVMSVLLLLMCSQSEKREANNNISEDLKIIYQLKLLVLKYCILCVLYRLCVLFPLACLLNQLSA